MEIKDYNPGDKVSVLMNNPRLDNKNEWRNAEVIKKEMIHPQHGPSYPVLIVKVIRTYCKIVDTKYKWVDGFKVYVKDILEFFDKENTEMIIYSDTIKKDLVV